MPARVLRARPGPLPRRGRYVRLVTDAGRAWRIPSGFSCRASRVRAAGEASTVSTSFRARPLTEPRPMSGRLPMPFATLACFTTPTSARSAMSWRSGTRPWAFCPSGRLSGSTSKSTSSMAGPQGCWRRVASPPIHWLPDPLSSLMARSSTDSSHMSDAGASAPGGV